MSELLPLFPLGAVLYPGMLLPLHIFEERYRQLVQDLLERPEPPQVGLVAIRQGRETRRRGGGPEHGRCDRVPVGTQRFRLIRLDETRPYYQGEIEPLTEDVV